jgi:hypothetical protein
VKLSRIAIIAAAFLAIVIAATPSRADSMTYSFTSSLTGSYKNTSITGSFSFNPTTNSVSGGSLVFNGSSIFGGLGTVTLSSIIGTKGQLVFTYLISVFNKTTHQTDKLDLQIFVTSAGAYATLGYVCDALNCAGYGSSKLSLQVPEGGSSFLYLLFAGFVIATAILFANCRAVLRKPAPLHA